MLTAIEPMLPGQDGSLADLAIEVVKASARLSGRVHPITANVIADKLKIINSYYSNLIEGHSTHPYDIERAMQANYNQDAAKRALQLESQAHIQVQDELLQLLVDTPDLAVSSGHFIRRIHASFYERLPDEFRKVRDKKTGEVELVFPGQYRKRLVEVGVHVPPDAELLDRYMARFEHVYLYDKLHGHSKLIAIAAAHHRLAWIHPFLDGNGRTIRLYTDASFHRVGLDGYGLWTVSRGLAKRGDDYKSRLAGADAKRRGDLDGRGNLSLQGLTAFCHFFLEVCLDQATYMESMLQIDDLMTRIEGYVAMRGAGLIPGVAGTARLPEGVTPMLQAIILRGEMPRGEITKLSGYGERKARDLLASLLEEGLLASETPKGAVRFGLPVHAMAHLFPDLFPVFEQR